MAGTLPHAVFVETDVVGTGVVAAYAAELPGCATFARSDTDAVRAMPSRVHDFTGWLRRYGETPPTIIGDNWYEVERAAATHGPDGHRRAAFSLDELSPSDSEFSQYLRWLELAREELADALDASADVASAMELLSAIDRQDRVVARELGGTPRPELNDPIDRLYASRAAL